MLKKGFYWGNSVSSMQTEGAYDEGGKGLSTYDIKEATDVSSDWKVAVDTYHRYIEDFDLMQEMGMNMYRFQISWSRVNPTGDGDWNEEGIAFYDQFIDELIKRGIEPMICLYHFDMPLLLAKSYDGFLSKHVVDAFARYGVEMVKRFGHKVKHWITFNEQNLYSMYNSDHIAGVLTEYRSEEQTFQIQHNVMMAHTYVANYIHEHTDCLISGMLAYSLAYPATSHPNDVYYARVWDEYANQNLLEAFTYGRYLPMFYQYIETHQIDLKATQDEMNALAKLRSDYLSFSYYASTTISHVNITNKTGISQLLLEGGQSNPNLEATEWDWQIDPLGFRDILNIMSARYHLPVFPIENGIGVQESWDGKKMIEDDYRIAYHADHIKAMMDAIEKDGVNVLGYLGWGLIDILSSRGDMRKRYGFVYVNRDNHDLKDLKRVPKKSFNWFKEVTKSNGESLKNSN